MCELVWWVDGAPAAAPIHSVTASVLPEEEDSNQFQSVRSTLSFNLDQVRHRGEHSSGTEKTVAGGGRPAGVRQLHRELRGERDGGGAGGGEQLPRHSGV